MVSGAPPPKEAPRPRAGFTFALGFAAALAVVSLAIAAMAGTYFLYANQDPSAPGDGVVSAPSAARPIPPEPRVNPKAQPTRPTEPALKHEPPFYTRDTCAPASGDMCDCCPSGHDCLGAPCKTLMQPDEKFRLRLAGGGIGGRHIHEALPGGKVCEHRGCLSASMSRSSSVSAGGPA